jgi:hypothetical protein
VTEAVFTQNRKYIAEGTCGRQNLGSQENILLENTIADPSFAVPPKC